MLPRETTPEEKRFQQRDAAHADYDGGFGFRTGMAGTARYDLAATWLHGRRVAFSPDGKSTKATLRVSNYQKKVFESEFKK